MTKPLPYDMSRCYGDQCDKKERCKRFLTMAIDEPRLLSYVLTMVRNGVCNDMIEDK
jgi:hypothetical protein